MAVWLGGSVGAKRAPTCGVNESPRRLQEARKRALLLFVMASVARLSGTRCVYAIWQKVGARVRWINRWQVAM